MKDSVESYLDSLSRSMLWMGGKRRQDILREVRSHLTERVEGGERAEDVIAEFGPPGAIAREYRRIYGYGSAFTILLMVTGAVIAAFSVPALYLETEEFLGMDWPSLGLLTVGIVLIIVTSMRGGRRAGTAVGAAEAASRFGVVIGLAIGGNLTWEGDSFIGIFGFVFATILLPLIGYVANTVKREEREPEI